MIPEIQLLNSVITEWNFSEVFPNEMKNKRNNFDLLPLEQ